MKKLIISICVLAIILTAGILVYQTNYGNHSATTDTNNDKQNYSAYEAAKDPKYTDFTVHGKISSIKANEIVFYTTVIKDGQRVPLEMTAMLDSKTTYFRLSSDGNSKSISAGDLKVGSEADFSTHTYPFNDSKISPYKITITK